MKNNLIFNEIKMKGGNYTICDDLEGLVTKYHKKEK